MEVLVALSMLRRDAPDKFVRILRQLKAAGCGITDLRKALADVEGGGGKGDETQADILIEIANAADLFHTADQVAYADMTIGGHRETWPVRSKGFKRWLVRQYYEKTKGAPNSEAMQAALGVIEAKAHFDGPEQRVDIRIGGLENGTIYVDLCDDAWRAVEIDADGWRIVDEPPLRFRRTPGMLPLPVPVRGGSIDDLRPFLNVGLSITQRAKLGTGSDPDTGFVLAVAWALAALNPNGPYPVLSFAGEQGTAKSTAARVLRSLVDPNAVPLRTPPRDDRDMFISANNAWTMVYDNLSSLSEELADAMCRLATGGGFAPRALYTDADEVLFNATRPQILNGIEDVVNRPDLADRCLFLTLEPISDEDRLAEKKFWAEFTAVQPGILGALLDGVSVGSAPPSRHRASRVAAHGGLRALGHCLRDGILAGGHLHGGLCRQPRRCECTACRGQHHRRRAQDNGGEEGPDRRRDALVLGRGKECAAMERDGDATARRAGEHR